SIVAVTSPPFSHTGLAAGSTHSYRVRAKNDAGTSAFSGTVTATTPTATCSTLPSVPTNLHSTSVTSDSVSLAWNASNPGANCTAQYIVSRNGAQAGQTPNTSFTVTGLAAGTTFSFTVAAINQFGTSAQSAAIQATTAGGGGPPTAAELLAKVASCRQIS